MRIYFWILMLGIVFKAVIVRRIKKETNRITGETVKRIKQETNRVMSVELRKKLIG